MAEVPVQAVTVDVILPTSEDWSMMTEKGDGSRSAFWQAGQGQVVNNSVNVREGDRWHLK